MSWAAQSRSGGRAGAGDSPEPEELEDDSVEAIGQRVNKLLDDAKHAIAKQEYARAVNILTVALDYQPSVVLCRRLRCISAAASGLYSMALEDAKLIRELRPGNPEGATLSGHIYMRMQRCADAAAAYKEALDMDPGDVVVRDSFSRALLMMRSSVPGRSSEDGNGGGAARVSARGAPESPLNKLRHPRQPLLKTIGMDDVLEQTTNLAAVMESLAKEQSEAEAASRPATARKEARRAAAAAPAAAAPATAPGQEDGEPAVDAPTDGTAVVVPATPGAAPASEPGASNHGSTSVDNSAHLERTPKGSMRVKKGGDKTLGPGGRLEAKVPGTSMAGQGRYAAVAGGR